MSQIQIEESEKDKDERVTKEMFQKTQLLDLLILMLITLGTAFCTASYNLEFEGNYGFNTHSFLLMNMAFSITCCLFIVMRENLYLRMSKNRGTAKATDNLASTGRIKIILIECLLVVVHPYPFFVGDKLIYYNEAVGMHIYYHVNDFFQLFSLVRFVYFLTSILNISVWRSRSSYRIW